MAKQNDTSSSDSELTAIALRDKHDISDWLTANDRRHHLMRRFTVLPIALSSHLRVVGFDESALLHPLYTPV